MRFYEVHRRVSSGMGTWQLVSALLLVLTPGAVHAQGRTVATPVKTKELHQFEALTMDKPDDLAGISLNESQKTATIYVKRGHLYAAVEDVTVRVDRVRNATAGDVALELVEVEHSWSELESARNGLVSDLAWLSKFNSEPILWYIDPVSNAVRLGLSDISPELKEAVELRFGLKCSQPTSQHPSGIATTI